MRFFAVLAGLLLTSFSISAQQTVGLFQYDSSAAPGYTLFAPQAYTETFLINNCGHVVHSWQHSTRPGLMGYLLEDGSLLRQGRVANPVFSGGGGLIEKLDWDGNVTWRYRLSNASRHGHHDIEPMPNGNVLVVAMEYKSANEALQAGRNPAVSTGALWPDMVLELRPIGTDSAEVVWEWHIWDHLIQDFDSTKDNYGSIVDFPRRIDLNFSTVGNSADWVHTNSVHYNAGRDEIVISPRNFSEIWVIDHSTTTAEAADSTGGNAGHGGDLLYRWGNPATYGRGTAADQQLFVQHDPRWVPDGFPGSGHITIFNNGTDRPGGNFSTVDEIVPPLDSSGHYLLDSGQAFGPAAPVWSYIAPVPGDFYSGFISGAQRLPNGHTLVCEGLEANIFEVDSTGNMIWQYISPVDASGPVSQGYSPMLDDVFRAMRYPPDYPAFAGREMTGQGPLELNPAPAQVDCELVSRQESEVLSGLEVFPNPFSGAFDMRWEGGKTLFQIVDAQGRIVEERTAAPPVRIQSANWAKGVYFVWFPELNSGTRVVKF